jgi:hypothetical protein
MPVDAAVLGRAAAEIGALRGSAAPRRGAAASAGRTRIERDLGRHVTLSKTSRAVSSGRMGTACCATMSPASGLSIM